MKYAIESYVLWEKQTQQVSQKERIILVGPGASGKDYAKSILEDAGLEPAVLHTTRERREGEIDGLDYNYISFDTFEQYTKENKWVQYTKFGEHYYGVSKDQMKKAKVMILPPKGISMLTEEERAVSLIIYFDIARNIRKERLASRSDASKNLENRLRMDDEAFAGFDNYDIKITDEAFGPHDIIKHL